MLSLPAPPSDAAGIVNDADEDGSAPVPVPSGMVALPYDGIVILGADA